MTDPTETPSGENAETNRLVVSSTNNANDCHQPGFPYQVNPTQPYPPMHHLQQLQHQSLPPQIMHPPHPYAYQYPGMTHNNVVYNAAGAMNNYAYNNAQHPNSVNAYPTTHNNNAIPPNNIAYNSFGVANQGQVPESVIIGNISSNCSVASGLTTAPAIPNGNPNIMLQAVPPMMMGVQQPQQAVPILSQQIMYQQPPPTVTGAAATTTTQTQTIQSQVTTTQPQQRPPLHSQKGPSRAIHRIHLSSLRHNYNEIQSAAAQQQCQVITVVKADGYGHGSLFTACHLVEKCGADAFAVATLEEGVALRKALEEKFHTGDAAPAISNNSLPNVPLTALPRRVRILVLGAPVGYPTCFDKYLHYDIELMLSGPEVAASLGEWMRDHESRKRAEVQRAAERRKKELLRMDVADQHPMRNRVVRQVQNQEGTEEAKGDDINGCEATKATEFDDLASKQTSTTVTNSTIPTNAISHTTENVISGKTDPKDFDKNITGSNIITNSLQPVSPSKLQTKMNAATLTNVTGADLAREVRQILIGQRHAAATAFVAAEGTQTSTLPATVTEGVPADGVVSPSSSSVESTTASSSKNKEANATSCAAKSNADVESNIGKAGVPPTASTPVTAPATAASSTTAIAGGNVGVFCGIEDAAKASRQRELRAIRRSQLQSEESSLGSEELKPATNSGDITKVQEGNNCAMSSLSPSRRTSGIAGNLGEPPQIRKKLRWHALVDSGMGRLGFKTDQVLENQPTLSGVGEVEDTPFQSTSVEFVKGATHVPQHNLAGDGLSVGSISSVLSDHSGCGSPLPQPVSLTRDTVSIIKELYDAEVHDGAAIEFYGMCTHMADASPTSTYTQAQMDRFRSLLYRVRSAGIAVPTVSTDNSAALLTTSLTHFDPHSILSHDTRGYVRTGGGIYGQRPAFKQLRAVSTLTATVKHVSVIQKGESVGYDRAYVAPTDVRIATLTIGFADGYPRELGNGVGRVSMRGATFPVAGNVCMDMMMVDLGAAGDCDGIGAQVVVGDVAVLWGPEGLNDTNVKESGDGLVPLADLASKLKTTQSALTCGLDKLRVQRQYVE